MLLFITVIVGLEGPKFFVNILKYFGVISVCMLFSQLNAKFLDYKNLLCESYLSLYPYDILDFVN